MGWPKYLRKVYTKEELNKKVLKKVQLDHDKTFLTSLFHSEKRGEWRLREDLTKTEKKRLKKIVKEIKAGRGGVKTLPLLFLLILVAGITLFTLFFKNPIAEKLLESSLESLFGATVEADNLNVSLLNVSVELDRLAITDEENLERNLVELGFTRVSLNGRALLQKKVVIESLECRDMGWDTHRDIPGTLIVDRGKGEGASRDINVLPFLEEQGGSSMTNFSRAVQDPEAFVQEQWDSLQSPAAAQSAVEKYERLIPEHRENISETQSSSREVISGLDNFLKRDFTQYKDNPTEIPALVKEADEYGNAINDSTGSIQAEIESLDALRKSIDADRKELLRLKDEDYNQMKSLISLPQGGVEGVFRNMIQSYIASLLGDKYTKVMTIWGYFQKYRQLSAEDKETDSEPSGRRRGRLVSFDSPDWPSFLLKKGSFSALGGDLSWEAEVHDIAGEPERWNQPATFDLALNKGNGTLAGEGVVDLRQEQDSLSEGQAEFSGLPLSSRALSSMGISELTGGAGGHTTFRADRDSWLVQTDLILADTQMEKSGDDLITDLVYSVLASEDWEMVLTFEGEGDQFNFGLDWPLLLEVDDQIGNLLKEQSAEFLKEVEQEFTSRITGELDQLEQYTGDLDEYTGLLNGDLSSLTEKQDEVSSKVEEAKKQAASQASEKTNEVLENTGVKDAAESAGDALKSLF